MQALGLIETRGLLTAIESADAMLKAADVCLLEKTYVGGGLVSIAITGDVAAVKAAVEAGEAAVRKINSKLLVSQHVIPRLHEGLDNVIVSTVPLKNGKMSTVVSVKTESEDKASVETIEENIIEVTVEDKETVVEESTLRGPLAEESLIEKTADTKNIDISELHNRESVDKLVLEYGLDKAIEILSRFKVIELRNLALLFNNFGMAEKRISKAGKKLLLEELRKHYR